MFPTIIRIPSDLTRMLHAGLRNDAADFFGDRGMTVDIPHSPDKPCHVYAHPLVLTPTGLEDSWSMFLVLSDADARLGRHRPEPIPAPVARRYLARFRDTLFTHPGLSGHEKMQLAEIFEALSAPPLPLPAAIMRDEIDSLQQWRNIERGKALQTVLQEPLARFDADLETYDPTVSIGEQPVFGLVDALGRQAALARHLAETGIGSDWAALTQVMRRGDPRFLERQGLCESQIEGHDDGLLRAGLRWPNSQSGWTGAAARMLHERVMGRLLPAEELGRYRREDAGLDPETGLAGLPVSVIPEQMRLFRHVFTSKLWPDCHPIIRAGLGHLHLLRTRPFEQGNGEVARLLLSMQLQSRGMPELPLDLVLAARQEAYRATVRAALLGGDVAGFLRFLIEACHAALHLAQDIAVQLRAEIDRLTAAMTQMRTGIVEVEALAVYLCSRLVVRDHHVVFASHAHGDAAIAVVRALARAGQLDEADLGSEIVWSVPGVRILLDQALKKSRPAIATLNQSVDMNGK